MADQMLDQKALIRLFEEIGVVCAVYDLHVTEDGRLAWLDAPDTARSVVQAGTTGFYFDTAGRYLGYEAEEPKFFMPRVPKGEPCRREAI